MRILWIVNKPIGALHVKLTCKKATGGLWMEAMLNEATEDPEMEISVVNIDKVKAIKEYNDGNITYYTIPGLANEHYDYKSALAHKYWKYIIIKTTPELIVLWGTELPYGMVALEEAQGIPSIVFVQGILDSIGKYYQAGMNPKELRSARSLRDIFTGCTITQRQRDYFRRSSYEAAIVNKAKNIIIENKWAEAYYIKMCPNVRVFKCPLCISNEFEQEKWTCEKMRPHTLMCSAASYPIKGLHMLLKALKIVKRHYPDVVLNIPGTPLRPNTSFLEIIKQNGYEKFIRKQIKEQGLLDTVNYTGRLSATEMAKLMSESNVFVMCSAIENHSSTLKEAMTVGVPCVASYVGGVPEYAINEENCLLYRFEDYEVLALNIIRLFKSNEFCKKLSEKSINDMRISREKNDFYKISKDIYQALLLE